MTETDKEKNDCWEKDLRSGRVKGRRYRRRKFDDVDADGVDERRGGQVSFCDKRTTSLACFSQSSLIDYVVE